MRLTNLLPIFISSCSAQTYNNYNEYTDIRDASTNNQDTGDIVDLGVAVVPENVDSELPENDIASLPTAPTPVNINLNLQESAILKCNRPSEQTSPSVMEVNRQNDNQNIVWDYAKDMAAYEAQDVNIIVLYNVVDVNKKDVSHLDGQVSVSQGNDDIYLETKTISSGGVYVCRNPNRGQDEIYSVIEVSVINEPELYIGDSKFVAGETVAFTCEASGAYPKPEMTLFLDDIEITTNNNNNNPVQISTGQDAETSLYTVTAEYTFTVDESARELSFKCVADSEDWPNGPISKIENKRVEFSPIISSIKNTEITVGTKIQSIECEILSYPDSQISWSWEGFSGARISKDNKLIIDNAKIETHNNKTVTCTAVNSHGSDTKSATLSVITPEAAARSGGIGSNLILIIGIVIGIILLSIIGFTVVLKRKKNSSQYETNENNKEAGPEGVDYEQNPEREALAPEEQHTQKELMM